MSDEWAKTAGKGIDAACEFGKFLAPIVKAPLVNAIGIFSDKLAYMRWERQQRLMKRANEFMLEQGLSQPTRAVPLNVAIPLMQAASMEEDDELQDMWAKLLVNALDADSGVEVQRSFVSILKDLTPYEAKLLNQLYTINQANPDMASRTYALPTGLIVHSGPANPAEVPPKDEKVQIALWNLVRLGCISSLSLDQRQVSLISLTSLGVAFVAACNFKSRSS